jgi:hypothetical protein
MNIPVKDVMKLVVPVMDLLLTNVTAVRDLSPPKLPLEKQPKLTGIIFMKNIPVQDLVKCLVTLSPTNNNLSVNNVPDVEPAERKKIYVLLVTKDNI